jgi:signal peptide peptidase SppA
VSAILIDANTPGGTIAGVTELAAEMYAARGRKPIVAHANALAASAGYWIVSAADEIVATPSADVGAIGVITAHVDTSKAEEAEGVTRTVVSAGKYKAEGHGPISEEGLAALQARVDDAYAVMTKDIARGRGVSPADVRAGFGEGRVVSAKEALKLGMIDRIATFDETVARMTGRRVSGGMRAEAEPEFLSADMIDHVADVLAGPLAEADRRRRLERF